MIVKMPLHFPQLRAALISPPRFWASLGQCSFLSGYRCKSTVAPAMERSEDVTYLHKLDDFQKNFIYAHRANTRYPSPWLTLNSKKPLTSEVVFKAMQHIHRKSHYRQLAVRERDGELWWCNQKEVEIDFKVVDKGMAKFDIIDDLWYSGFNENGPLWKVRYIPANENDPCPLPDLKKEFPYQSYLLGVFHHACTDGMTAALITQAMVDMINAVIEGENIDDSVPLGEFVANEELQKAEHALKETLLKDPERFQVVKEEVLKADKPPLLLRYFPRPEEENPTTKNISLYTPPAVLKKFFSQCKKNGVSPGSAFQAATNTALIELAQEAGATDDSYDISVNLATDLRRYLKKREYPIFGLHIRTMTSVISMGKNVREDFWKNCKEVEDVNKNLLKSGAVVEQNILRQMIVPSKPAEEFYKTLPVLNRDYGYSNMGNFDRVVSGLGKHVQLSCLEQYSSIQQFIYPFFQQIFTYRGNFICALSYATDCLTDDTAGLLVKKISSLIAYYSEN